MTVGLSVLCLGEYELSDEDYKAAIEGLLNRLEEEELLTDITWHDSDDMSYGDYSSTYGYFSFRYWGTGDEAVVLVGSYE